jgi:hypothetical protein
MQRRPFELEEVVICVALAVVGLLGCLWIFVAVTVIRMQVLGEGIPELRHGFIALGVLFIAGLR